MLLNHIFHISDFHNLKIVNYIFFFIFEDGLIFLSRDNYIYIYIYIYKLKQITSIVVLSLLLLEFHVWLQIIIEQKNKKIILLT